jgi:hypothetical protein
MLRARGHTDFGIFRDFSWTFLRTFSLRLNYRPRKFEYLGERWGERVALILVFARGCGNHKKKKNQVVLILLRDGDSASHSSKSKEV